MSEYGAYPVHIGNAYDLDGDMMPRFNRYCWAAECDRHETSVHDSDV